MTTFLGNTLQKIRRWTATEFLSDQDKMAIDRKRLLKPIRKLRKLISSISTTAGNRLRIYARL
jgi:hypothetical protein